MPMSKEEMLARIQAGAINMNEPILDPETVKKIQAEQASRSQQGWNLPIEPSRPDPQAEAQRLIQDHISQMKGQPTPQGEASDVQQMVKARAGNPINPETGMPSFSAPAPESPEEAERKQQMQFKMQYLKNQASGQR